MTQLTHETARQEQDTAGKKEVGSLSSNKEKFNLGQDREPTETTEKELFLTA